MSTPFLAMKLGKKEEEKLLRQLEVLRRFVENVEGNKRTIEKGIEDIKPS